MSEGPIIPQPVADVLLQIRASESYELSGDNSTTVRTQHELDGSSNRGLREKVCVWLLVLLTVGVAFLMVILVLMGWKIGGFDLPWQAVTSFSAVVVTQSWTTIRQVVSYLFPSVPKTSRGGKKGKGSPQ